MKPRLWIALLLLGSVRVAAQDPGVLRVGLDTRTPPWSYVPGLDSASEDLRATPAVTEAQLRGLAGLDVDVARSLARRLGRSVRFVPVAWFAMEDGLLAKHYDVIVGAWTPSRKTPPTIRASASYYDWGLLIATRADDKRVRSYTDLARLKTGHYRDPASEQTLRSLGVANLVPMDDAELLFEELRNGEIDALVFDSLYVRWRVANDKAFQVVGAPLNKLGYHVGVRTEDQELFQKVQSALADLLGSEEIKQIRQRWEGAAAPASTRSSP
jgi:polar amino acid transport system substrate-binding protein